MNKNKRFSRRVFVTRGLQLPVSALGAGTLLALSACEGDGDSAFVCADPGAMTSAEDSVRRALKYQEISPNASKVCAACAFFKPGEGVADCGRCEIFDGGPANPGGYCDSWSKDS